MRHVSRRGKPGWSPRIDGGTTSSEGVGGEVERTGLGDDGETGYRMELSEKTYWVYYM